MRSSYSQAEGKEMVVSHFLPAFTVIPLQIWPGEHILTRVEGRKPRQLFSVKISLVFPPSPQFYLTEGSKQHKGSKHTQTFIPSCG